MGNTICDRLFSKISQDDVIEQYIKENHVDAWATCASLNAETRRILLHNIRDNIDPAVLRFYEASETTRSVAFEAQSIADSGKILPKVDQQTAKRWSLEETRIYLKDLNNLIKEASNTSLITNEINYITHLSMLAQNKYEQKIKEEIDGKSNFMAHAQEKFSQTTSKSTDEVNDHFVSSLIKVTLNTLSTTCSQLVASTQLPKFQGLIIKCKQISEIFHFKDKSSVTDNSLNDALEKVMNSLVQVAVKYKSIADKSDLRILITLSIKIAFFIGKISLHLLIIETLTSESITHLVELEGVEAVPELESFSPIVSYPMSSNHTWEVGFLKNKDKVSKATVYCDADQMILCQSDEYYLLNRVLEYEPCFSELSGTCHNLEFLTNFDSTLWAHDSKEHCLWPVKPTSMTNPEIRQMLKVPEKFEMSIEHDPLLKEYALTHTFSNCRYFKITPEERHFVIAYKPNVKGNFILTIACERDGKIVSEVMLKPTLKKSEPASNLNRIKNLVLIADTLFIVSQDNAKSVYAFDVGTGNQLGSQYALSHPVSGIDPVRMKLIEVGSSNRIQQYGFTVVSKYMTNKPTSQPSTLPKNIDEAAESIPHSDPIVTSIAATEKPATEPNVTIPVPPPTELPLPEAKLTPKLSFDDYIDILLKINFSAKLGHCSLDGFEISQLDEIGPVLFQRNRIDIRPETFALLAKFLEEFRKEATKPETSQLALVFMKLLETHTFIAASLQDIDHTHTRAVKQETIIRLIRTISRLNLGASVPVHNRSAFASCKLNIIRSCLMMAIKIKNVTFLDGFIDTLLTEDDIFSVTTVSRCLIEIFKTQTKGTENYGALIATLFKKIKSHSAEVALIETHLFQGEAIPNLEKYIIRRSNLKTVFSCLIMQRSRIDLDQLENLVYESITDFEPSIKAFCVLLTAKAKDLENLPSLIELQDLFLNSFVGFAFFQAVSFMSYSPFWARVVEKLTELCNQFSIAGKSANYATLPQTIHEENSDNERIEKTELMKLDGSVANVTVIHFSRPMYSKIKVWAEEVDDSRTSILVFTKESFDNFNLGSNSNSDLTKCFYRPCEGRVTSFEPLTVEANDVYIAVVIEASHDHTDLAGKIFAEGFELALKRTSKLDNLVKICSGFVMQQLLKEIKAINDSKDQEEHISEQLMLSLEVVLASQLFENGFLKPQFEVVEKEYSVKLEAEMYQEPFEKYCHQHFCAIQRLFHMSSKQSAGFDDLCLRLQADCSKKMRQTTILGELGQILSKSVFLVILKHSLRLQEILEKLASDEVLELNNELKKLWVGCAKARVICKDYETERQFQDFFNKLAILISIDPSLSWETEPPVSSPHKHLHEADLNEGVIKMKMYIENLRLNSSSPNQKGSNALVETVMRFLGMAVSSSQIIGIIENRNRHFELFGKVIDLVMDLMNSGPNSIYEAMIVFNKLFRKDSQAAGYLMMDYSGLPRSVVAVRISNLRTIMKNIMDFICQDRTSKPDQEGIMLAIESMKWIWRGKEIDCVHQIDISKIWNAVGTSSLHLDEKFRLSMIDLCYVLLKFCARKAKELTSSAEDDGLSLKKTTSVIDETSFSAILNQNFNFLNTLLKQDIDEFDKASILLTKEEYDILKQHSRTEAQEKVLKDLVLMESINGFDESLFTVKECDILELVPKKDSEKETALKAIVDKLVQNYKQHGQSLNRCNEELFRILSIFYFYVYGTPDMATLFFESIHNLDPIVKIAFGNYPDAISLFATRIIEALSAYLSADMLFLNGTKLEDLFELVKPYYSAIFDKSSKHLLPSRELHMARLSLIRKLLYNPGYSTRVEELLKIYCASKNAQDILLVLDILDSSNTDMTAGSLVYDKYDPMKEQLMILELTPSLLTKSYLRDVLYYKYDITNENKIRERRSDRIFLMSEKLLAVCLRTKNHVYLDKTQVHRFDQVAERGLLNSVLESINLPAFASMITADNETGYLIMFRLSRIINQSQNASYKSMMQDIVEKLGAQPTCEGRGWAEEEATTAINDYIDHVARQQRQVFPSLSKESSGSDTTPASHYNDFKQKLYNKLRKAPSPSRINTWATAQFSSARLAEDSKVNFNIGNYITSLKTPQQIDQIPELCKEGSSKSALKDVVRESVQSMAMKCNFLTREESDLVSLLEAIINRQILLRRRNSDLVEIDDLTTMANVLVGDPIYKDKLIDAADQIMKKPTTLANLASMVELLTKLVVKCANIELSKQFCYYLIDQVCLLSDHFDQIRRNTWLVNLYVSVIETFVGLTRSFKKDTLTLDEHRAQRLTDSVFKHFQMPFVWDTTTFKRQHRQEYVVNITLHFLRYLFDYWSVPLTLSRTIPVDLPGNILNPNIENLLIKAIIHKKLLKDNELENSQFKLKLETNKLYTPHIFKHFKDWMVLRPNQTNLIMNLSKNKSGIDAELQIYNTDQTEYKKGHLGVFREFSITPDTQYYLTTHFVDNYCVFDASKELLAFMEHFKPNNSPYLTFCDTDYAVVGGNVMSTNDGFHYLEEGCTCAAFYPSEQHRAYYFGKTKQIKLMCNSSVHQTKYKYGITSRASTRATSIFECIDLSDYPTVVRMHFLNSDCLLCTDETGGSIYIKPHNDPVTFSITELFGEFGEVIKADNYQLHYARQSDRRMVDCFLNTNGMRGFIFQTEKDIEYVIYKSSGLKTWYKIPDKQFKKYSIFRTEDLLILTHDGQIFLHNLSDAPPLAHIPITKTNLQGAGFIKNLGNVFDVLGKNNAFFALTIYPDSPCPLMKEILADPHDESASLSHAYIANEKTTLHNMDTTMQEHIKFLLKDADINIGSNMFCLSGISGRPELECKICPIVLYYDPIALKLRSKSGTDIDAVISTIQYVETPERYDAPIKIVFEDEVVDEQAVTGEKNDDENQRNEETKPEESAQQTPTEEMSENNAEPSNTNMDPEVPESKPDTELPKSEDPSKPKPSKSRKKNQKKEEVNKDEGIKPIEIAKPPPPKIIRETPQLIVSVHRPFQFVDVSGKNFLVRLEELLEQYVTAGEAAPGPPPENFKRFKAYKADLELVESDTAPNFEDEYLLVVKVVGNPKMEELSNFLSSIKPSPLFNNDLASEVYFVPDYFKMSDQEFEIFKEDTKPMWQYEIDTLKAEYLKNKELIMNTLLKKMEDEMYSRSLVHKIFEMEKAFEDLSEYSEYFRSNNSSPDDLNVCETVYMALRILNYSFARYLQVLPTYQGRNLDNDFFEDVQANLFPTYMQNMAREQEHEYQRSIYVDRVRGLNNTQLKRQNFSLLNQFTYEIAEKAHENQRYDRVAFESLEMNFKGEGRK